jgi:predicted nucleic acid-binding protein
MPALSGVACRTPSKAVLDTQLVVRGLVRRRKSAAVELFDLALEGVRMLAVTSPVLLEEYESVLRLPHVRGLTNPPLDDDLIQRAILYIGERFIVVAGAFKDVDKVPDDAKDNPLVEAALEGAAPQSGQRARRGKIVEWR